MNLYIRNDAYEKINALIEKRRQEGAREKDVRFQQQLQCFLNWGFVYMRLRWSVRVY
ncbi:relaxosome protein TraM, partial [Escherichia coli]|uniref:relaxosome protein TraM n=1 Tax=Escherichia coli TaxID=562 RepID=UPI003917CBE4